ncbi:MAG: TIGR03936 family radical SAM-associated protein [Actinobacteria bacterium]|nr:TIGR03936 family radical SAM-associated protein [Actinomycetota bacterium]MCA1720295.1 TIGR03936 family radical SAM-associated protein [Actinomycetota bacterium]
MSKRTPEGPPPPPTVLRVRLRYTKRGRLRFTSHRDIARAFERALRRAQVPMAYSAGFSPHPKISWVGAAPTGVASEAEYVELGLAERVDLEQLRLALDDSLPVGIDVEEVVEAPTGTSLPDRIQASRWEIRLPGVDAADALRAGAAFLAAAEVPVERLTKNGMRTLDARAAVVSLRVEDAPCAILHLVVRHVTPAVRPDDVLSGLRSVADLVPPVPPEATRYAQGPLTENGEVGDPLAPDRLEPEPAGATRQDADRDEAVAGSPT